MKRICNTCLEEEEINKNASWMYVCHTCEGGFICNGCIPEFDPQGSIFGTERYVKKTLRCPCCRTLNWNYHYNQIIKVTLGYDLEYYEDERNSAIILYLNNKDNY